MFRYYMCCEFLGQFSALVIEERSNMTAKAVETHVYD